MSDALKLVVFDCDGTLVDSQDMILQGMRAACERMGLPPAEDEAVRRVVGLSLFNAVKQLMPGHSDATVEEIVAHYRDAFGELRQNHNHEPLYPGTREAIEALDEAGYLLGIATGKSGRGLRNTLKLHDLEPYFVTIQTADGNPSKPHPEMLEKAMREAGAGKENTVLIGDTSYDMLMATNAGASAIGVSWGYHPADELVAAGAHHVANDYDQVQGLVQRLIG